ncbi:MAG: XrtA system polysaccharide deacetylase [Vicinamibacterales bacterium]
MTIDLEDWFHCLDPDPRHWNRYERRADHSTRQVLEIFARTGTRATFFVLADVARHAPALITEIAAAGHEIASHGSEHRFIYSQTRSEFERDVAASLDLLEEITGERPVGYRAPYFSITKRSLWARTVLRELGIRYDSSVHPVHNHRYGIPDAPRLPHETDGVVEAPISTFPMGRLNVPCAGGVYFRAVPAALTCSMLHRLDRRGEPIVFYLHPWELDPQQPRIPLPMALRARHYWALDRTAHRLERLCRTFCFGTLREALRL